MSFWGDMAANATGGVITGAILGTWALWFTVAQQIRGHDERIADLDEDNRRWFRDRDTQLAHELSRLKDEHAGRGTHQGSMKTTPSRTAISRSAA